MKAIAATDAAAEKTQHRGKDAVVTEAEIEKLRLEWKSMAKKGEKRRIETVKEEEEKEHLKKDEEEEEEGGSAEWSSSSSSMASVATVSRSESSETRAIE